MCTAATYKTKDFYFAEPLIMNFPTVMKSPFLRPIPFHFRHSDKAPDSHYAIIGMAHGWRLSTLL